MRSSLSIEQHLESCDKELAGHYLTLRRELGSVQSRWCSRWPEGNDHGPDHVERVLEYLDALVGPTPVSSGKLSEFELYLAMIAVVAHDIGILHGREGHAKKSAEIIERVAKENKFLLASEWTPLLESIIVCHSSSANIDAECPHPLKRKIGKHSIRPRVVAALVRLADELDEDYRRAQKWQQNIIAPPKASEPYWRFCQRIRGIQVEDPGGDIAFQVAFENGDFAEDHVAPGETFLQFFATKIAKINRERAKVMTYLGDDFMRKRLRIELVDPKWSQRGRFIPPFDFNDQMGANERAEADAAKLYLTMLLDHIPRPELLPPPPPIVTPIRVPEVTSPPAPGTTKAQDVQPRGMASISWLHLSDLHQGMDGQAWLWPNLRECPSAWQQAI